jgi:phosphoribosylformimino-5-aminoimidazole carboxamide ribotide isomerase
MNVVPVIDLLRGQVVRGVRGDRAQYRPIVSALVGSAEPLAVAERLCEHCATERLYVADLDALQGRPAQIAVLQGLLQARPDLRLWLDAGLTGSAALEGLLAALGSFATRVTPVLASESIASQAELSRCLALAPDALLSLDRRGAEALDPAGLWDAPARWPHRVIVMTLERVGADAGPDLATLAAVRARAPQARLIGAGGIRGPADLAAAAAAGAQGWLVASALHDGRIAATKPRTAALETRSHRPCA